MPWERHWAGKATGRPHCPWLAGLPPEIFHDEPAFLATRARAHGALRILGETAGSLEILPGAGAGTAGAHAAWGRGLLGRDGWRRSPWQRLGARGGSRLFLRSSGRQSSPGSTFHLHRLGANLGQGTLLPGPLQPGGGGGGGVVLLIYSRGWCGGQDAVRAAPDTRGRAVKALGPVRATGSAGHPCVRPRSERGPQAGASGLWSRSLRGLWQARWSSRSLCGPPLPHPGLGRQFLQRLHLTRRLR